MGGAACKIIIDGNEAYAVVEYLNNRYKVNTYKLEAAITASCNVVPYVSLYLKIGGDYLGSGYTQPIIDLHNRIITELSVVSKENAQALVDELTILLFVATRVLEELV